MLPCLFNLYAEYITQNARLDKAQAGIKNPGRTINNLRYVDDTTLMAKRNKKTLDEGERGERKAGLKLSIQKTKIMASGPITAWRIEGETVETVAAYIFELQNPCRW